MKQLLVEHLDVWTAAIETRSTAGRGSSNKLNLYGIKKLRSLILELAVRGQLVAQDPTDEPAEVLLQKIAAEKARLIKDGKLKKQEPLPPITDDEKPFELPKGWEWVSLSHLGVFSGGKTPSKMNNSYWNGNIPWVTPKDMKVDDIYDSEDYVTSKAIEDGLSLVEPNSLLFVVRSGILRRAFPVAVTKVTCTVNQDLKVLTLFNRKLSDYIFLMMRGFEQYILRVLTKTGTTVESIKFDEFSKHYFMMPPLAEQHRIVAKVNELMSLCDALESEQASNINAHQVLVENLLAELTQKTPSPQPLSREAGEGLREDHATSCSPSTASRERGLGGEGLSWRRIAAHFDTLFITEHSIDQLKQTILQLAVMGKLVPQDPTDEPASVLLKKIAAEKARLVKAGKIKKEKPLPPIAEDEKPFELPQGWAWCRVWDVSELITSGSRDWAKYYSDRGAIFVTMGNLSRGDYKLRMDSIRYIQHPADGEGSRTRLIEGDLLISITGDVGNLGLIPKDFGEAYINQHTCLLRFMPNCRNRYFPELMRSPLAKYQFDAPQRGIKNSFRLGDVGEMIIPIPPLAEQQRIVAKVDELMTLCDQIKARIHAAQTTQLHLADVLAAQAIVGTNPV